MVTVKITGKYKGDKPKWFDNFIGETFECYPTLALSGTYTIFHLTDSGLNKLSLLRNNKRSIAALIYSEYCKVVKVGSIPVRQYKIHYPKNS